jgi:acyl dehydratase
MTAMTYPIKGRMLEEFRVGETFESHGRTLTEADLVNFLGFVGDYEPVHADEEFAKKTPLGKRIMNGSAVTSVVDGLISRMGLFEGTAISILACTWEFKAPVFINDTVRAQVKVTEARPSKKGGRGVVVFGISVLNQAGQAVITGSWTMLVVSKAPPAG